MFAVVPEHERLYAATTAAASAQAKPPSGDVVGASSGVAVRAATTAATTDACGGTGDVDGAPTADPAAVATASLDAAAGRGHAEPPGAVSTADADVCVAVHAVGSGSIAYFGDMNCEVRHLCT